MSLYMIMFIFVYKFIFYIYLPYERKHVLCLSVFVSFLVKEILELLLCFPISF
jgi:hypothetical protein